MSQEPEKIPWWFFCKIIIYARMYVCVCVCVYCGSVLPCMYVNVESIAFHHVGPRNQPQVIRLGGKRFDSMSHHTGSIWFLKNMNNIHRSAKRIECINSCYSVFIS